MRAPANRLPILLGAMTVLLPLSLDLYLPAFPEMQRDLGTSASAIQLTLTTFFAGLILGTLLIGPLSDRNGRRTPLMAGIVCFVLSTVLCAAAPSVGWLIAARFAQGFAVSAVAVICNAIVRDVSEGPAAARLYSLIMAAMILGPIVAPLFGSQLLLIGSWRLAFVLLVIYGTAVALMSRWLPETLPLEARRSGTLRDELAVFRTTFRDREFMAVNLGSGITLAAFLVYLGGSSIVLQDVYGLSAQLYGLVFALNSVGILFVTLLNRRLVGRVAPARLMATAMTVSAASGLVLAGGAILGLGLVAFLLPLSVIVACGGIINPNAFAIALARYPAAAGSAAALLTVTPQAFGASLAPLVGVSGSDTAVPMACTIAAMTLAGIVIYKSLASRRPKVETATDTDLCPADL